MNYEIVVDSSVNLPEALVDQYGLHVLSLEFNIDGKAHRSYQKNEITDLGRFYKMMREGKVITTSLVSLEDVGLITREVFEAGKDIFYLGFDSALSGSFENASNYMRQIRDEEYPGRDLRCVDSLAAALGHGLFAVEAACKRDVGASLDELEEWAIAQRQTFAHWFTVDDLNYLKRGGRLSAGAAFAGTLLSIKPILHVDEIGRLVPVDKIRSRKKSIQTMSEKFVKYASKPQAEQRIFISHADCIEEARQLATLITEATGASDILIHDLDPVIGAHSGPGTLALFFRTDVAR